MLPRRAVLARTALALFTALACGLAQAAWPERPITLIVPFAAGGGTDATGRYIAAGLEQELGVPVNVVNRTGASGFTGHAAMAEADPDGYTLGLITSVIGKFHWVGQSELDYTRITPLIMFNLDPAGFQVPASSPFQDLRGALDALAADPERFTISGGSQLGAWHMAFIRLVMTQDMDPARFRFVPTRGAAPALNELAAGGVDIAPTSLAEAKGLLDAGKLRALAVMDAERHPLFPDVPTVAEQLGVSVVDGAWRGLAAPAGLPADITARLTAALQTVYQSESFQSAMRKQGFGLRWLDRPEFIEFLKENDDAHGRILKALGVI